jgi:hypothetical protein
MALTKPSFTFANGLTGTNLYCKVTKIQGDKNYLICTIDIFLNKDSADGNGVSLHTVNAIFNHNLLDSDNVIKQSYTRLKSSEPIVPDDSIHFRDCTDC